MVMLSLSQPGSENHTMSHIAESRAELNACLWNAALRFLGGLRTVGLQTIDRALLKHRNFARTSCKGTDSALTPQPIDNSDAAPAGLGFRDVAMHASGSAEGSAVYSSDDEDQFYGELRDGDEMLDDLEGVRQ